MPGENVFNATITKADIVERVYDRIGFSKKEAAELVEMVFETIKAELKKGEDVKISGFGKFEVNKKKDRIGRNPRTGEQMIISARRVISFKVSQVLREVMKGENMTSARLKALQDREFDHEEDDEV
jgi:integration host factor subunit alpha